ncbi:hypothetical protein BV394_16030 (plasmid) [Brevirhabdus pacifica]|uniref:Uncharacterized protein n=3 Tax=Brevirhabdus pacifica TaxID=1267768 RepID=A0A1P8QYA9_9RHOB|nr:carbamoyltransferase [Brevirhabdus pacifica]APX91400.1 hypothetical protein BV394_16030 [Brevirhabdus pacifica]OWU74199.1 hypothetical protein ATO5_14770 [Loktanella sp. 22II-4b]PJJ79000.1 carbamoyltransferase [Brevirhabdus pacifica]
MHIVGLSAYYHDSAACILKDGEIVAAAQEERFTRIKHDPGFPIHALRYCLEAAGIGPGEVDHVVFYDKPFLKFERLLETYLAFAPRGLRSFATSMPVWIKDKLFQKSTLLRSLGELDPEVDWSARLLFSEHHYSHAASAFYPSPFETAAVLTMDGVGEWTTTSLALGEGNRLAIRKELHFPHSLGLLYSAFTHHAGFKVNSGEYKLMGLAPYGEPRFADLIRDRLIDIREDGSFRLNMSYFDYCTGLTMTNPRFEELMGGPARSPESPLEQRDMDIAASIQEVTEEIILKLARHAARETGQRDLCLAGGVALNCAANGVLHRAGIFDRIWIQPAAGDAGGALGAALAVWHAMLDRPRTPPSAATPSVVAPAAPGGEGGAPAARAPMPPDRMRGAYLGPSYGAAEIEAQLTAAGAVFSRLSPEEAIDTAARALAGGQALGWMSGRMEFGPRALGGRSILADPRLPHMQRLLNLKVKFRESFRPFAPSVLRERLEDWFELDVDSPYMLLIADVAARRRRPPAPEEAGLEGMDRLRVTRSEIPAVTHVDGSARIQTVDADTAPAYHALLSRFEALTGCPVLANTSFNVRGEPIICTPDDAFRCFMGTDLDMLVIEDFVLVKHDQDPALRQDYRNMYELD